MLKTKMEKKENIAFSFGNPVERQVFTYPPKDRIITFGCIVSPTCSNRLLPKYFSSEELLTYWKNVTFDSAMCHKTMLDRILEMYMDPDLVSSISDLDLFTLLNQKISVKDHPGIHIDSQADKDFDYKALIYAARSIGYILNNVRGTPEIVAYQRLCSEITKLPYMEQGYMIRVIEMKHGPIQYLAANVTNKNISFVMQKLKLTSSIKLIHEVFSNPTVIGKLGAIWQLLEIHEIIWLDIDWSILQDVVKFVYDIASWLFEKAKAFEGKLATGFEWIKAKCKFDDSNEKKHVEMFKDVKVELSTEEVIEKELSTPPVVNMQTKPEDIPIFCHFCAGLEVHFGCSECRLHFCDSCKDKKCCTIKNTHIYELNAACCEKISNQDCWWRAVAKAIGSDSQQLKRDIRGFLDAEGFREIAQKFFAQEGFPLEVDELIPMVEEQMKIEVQAQVDSVLVTQMYVNRPIHIYQDRVLRHASVMDPGWDENPINIHFMPGHYEYIHDIEEFKLQYGEPTTCSTLYGRVITCPHTQKEDSPTSSTDSMRSDILLKTLGIDISDNKLPPEKAEVIVESLQETSIGAKVKNWLEAAFTDSVRFFQENPVVGALFSLCAGLCTFLGFTIPFINGNVEKDGLIMRFTNATRSIYYAQKGTEGIMTAFKATIGAVKDVLGISTNTQVQAFKDQVANSLKSSNELLRLAQVSPTKFINSGEKFIEFQKKYDALLDTYVSLTKLSDSTDMKVMQPIWYPLARNYEKLTEIYNKFMAGLSERQVPVGIWMWGKTDIGKSALCSFLIDHVNRAVNNPDLKVFTVSKGPSYWNGYAQQAHIKIDDFNAIKTPEGDADAANFFNLITNAAYNPNQAAIQDKNTMANPLFVWVNSNFPTIPLDSVVTNREAFERRRHVFVHVSWPEHEKNCAPGNYKCEHFEGKTVENFDHLTLKLCDPNCTEYLKGGKNKIFSEDKIKEGTEVTVDELINAIVNKEQELRKNFVVAMERKRKMGTLDFADNSTILKQAGEDWVVEPVVFVHGPPGTGKSRILSHAVDRWRTVKNKKVRHIITDEDFTNWAKVKFISPEDHYVVIDDTSTHINNVHFIEFVEACKTKYDTKVGNCQVWVVAINFKVFKDAIVLAKGDEYFDVVWRRPFKISAKFRATDDKLNWLWAKPKIYTNEDVKRATTSAEVDRMVEYQIDNEIQTQQTVMSFLSDYVADIQSDNFQTSLLHLPTIDASIVCQTTVTSAGFFEIVNKNEPMATYKFLISGACTVSSRDMSYGAVLGALLRTMRDATAVATCKFRNFEDFLLQIVNSGYLAAFKGNVIVFRFKDQSYFLDAKNMPFRCGLIDNEEKLIKEAIFCMKEASKVVSSGDMLKIFSTALPPWFTLCGDIIHKVFAMSMSAIFATTGVMQQHQMFTDSIKATSIRENVQAAAEATMDSALSSVLDQFKNSTKTRQQPRPIYLDEHDPLKPVPEETPGAIDNQKKKNPRAYVEGTGGSKMNSSDLTVTEVGASVIEEVPKQYLQRAYDNQYKRLETFKQSKKYFDHKEVHTTKLPEIVKEMVTDPSLPTIISAVAKNVCQVESYSGNMLCHGLFVKDRIVTTVHHVLDDKSVEDLRIRTVDNKVYRVKKIFADNLTDRLDLEIDDKTCPIHRNIIGHFSTRDFTVPVNTPAVLLSQNREILAGRLVLYLRAYMIKDQKIVTYAGEQGVHRNLLKYVGHKIGYHATGVQTQFGDCGSILIIADPSWTKGKVVAMHTSGTTMEAYGRPLLQEQYSDIIANTECKPFKNYEILEPNLNRKFFDQWPLEIDMSVGRALKKQFVPTKTKIYRTLFPIGEKKFEPAILSNKDTRNPGHDVLVMQSLRWCQPRKPIPDEIRNVATSCLMQLADWYADKLEAQGVVTQILTKTESLNHLTGCPTSEPLNLQTSSGTPWRDMVDEYQGKTAYISMDKLGVRRLKTGTKQVDKLHAAMNEIINEHRTGRRASVVFLASSKDETVKLNKIYEGVPRTRTITASPLDFTIVYRMYLHSIQGHMASHWRVLPPKIGINPHSLDWNTLFLNMASVSVYGMDLDFTGWDFSHDPWMVEQLSLFYIRIHERLNPTFDKDDAAVIKTLYSHVAGFLMLVGNTVYKSTGGIPSGYPGTACDNSVFSDWMGFIIYTLIMRDKNQYLASIQSYREDVAVATYGDDKLETLSEYVKDMYNALTVIPYYDQMGFIATTGDKQEIKQPYKHLLDCTFLSRSFKKDGSLIVGPLLRDRLERATWWVHGSPAHAFWLDPKAICPNSKNMLDSAESLLAEAFLHGEETFKFYRKIVMKLFTMHDEPSPPNYCDYRTRIFGIPKFDNLREYEFFVFNERELLDFDLNFPQHFFKNLRTRKTVHFGPSYVYSGVVHQFRPIPLNLLKLLQVVNVKYERKWNGILINVYEQGGLIPFHKDNEPDLDLTQGVGCLTVSGDGCLYLRNAHRTYKVSLMPGDFYLMDGSSLTDFVHSRQDFTQKTVTFTFRRFVSSS